MSLHSPPIADRLYNRANRRAADGALAEAAILYRLAIAARPGFPEAYNNLGNALRAEGRLEAAARAYRTALRLGLDHPLVHYNLASVLKQADRREEAAGGFRRALALRPDYAEAHNNFGNLLRAEGRLAAAVTAYRRALATLPDWDEAHDNLGSALYLLHDEGGTAAAAGHAALWLRDHPGHPVARHIGAALAGLPGEPRASDDYVRQVFDHFAADFDEKLAELGYRAPALLAAALAGTGLSAEASLAILDAGCGTGLCAPHLRPYARALTGVDLSPGMLERAGARGLYDRLEEAELEAFLTGHPGAFDLIVAADVLCYFGALDAVLAGAARALRPGGRLAFTVERLDEAGTPHRVNPHGRYAHTETYVRDAILAAGFAEPAIAHDVLRQESGEPVLGLVVVARRPGA